MKRVLLTILLFVVIVIIKADNAYAQANMAALKAQDVCPLKVGSKIPSVVVRSLDEKELKLPEEVSKHPTVLIFFRGGWCVYCNRQLGELQTIEKELEALGYQIISISPDMPAKLRQNTEKAKFSYKLLSDSKMEAAKAFGIAFKVDDETVEKYKQWGIDLEGDSGETHHLLPVPAVFIIGTDGEIKFEYVNPNYKVRLDASVLLIAAKAYLK